MGSLGGSARDTREGYRKLVEPRCASRAGPGLTVDRPIVDRPIIGEEADFVVLRQLLVAPAIDVIRQARRLAKEILRVEAEDLAQPDLSPQSQRC